MKMEVEMNRGEQGIAILVIILIAGYLMVTASTDATKRDLMALFGSNYERSAYNEVD